MNKIPVCYRHLMTSLKLLCYGMENTVDKRKDGGEGNMYPIKWTEGFFFCINPYGPTVLSNSTTHSVVLVRASSSDRHFTF